MTDKVGGIIATALGAALLISSGHSVFSLVGVISIIAILVYLVYYLAHQSQDVHNRQAEG